MIQWYAHNHDDTYLVRITSNKLQGYQVLTKGGKASFIERSHFNRTFTKVPYFVHKQDPETIVFVTALRITGGVSVEDLRGRTFFVDAQTFNTNFEELK